jgi:hypothetical protein
MPVVNVQVDSRDVWRALNRPDEDNLVAAQGSKRDPLSYPHRSSTEPAGGRPTCLLDSSSYAPHLRVPSSPKGATWSEPGRSDRFDCSAASSAASSRARQVRLLRGDERTHRSPQFQSFHGALGRRGYRRIEHGQPRVAAGSQGFGGWHPSVAGGVAVPAPYLSSLA